MSRASHRVTAPRFTEPHQYPQGIPCVIVNGIVTVDEGSFVDRRAGMVLRRP